MAELPGLVVLFGSGEIAPSGRKVYDWAFSQLPSPVRVAVLETPAGFEPNSAHVAGRVADFVRQRLQNYHPEVQVVPARKRSTAFSPDDPSLLGPLLRANAVFLGPGSPSYTIRQLQDSLAWSYLLARHRRGAALVLASAATIAASAHALPVYEIYKVGEDLRWLPGLDFFGQYGLKLVFVSHWNNTEGGADLDTSRCYMGQARFVELLGMLPPDVSVVGIDEHTALAVDLQAGVCRVMGRGGVTLLRHGEETRFSDARPFSLGELGPFRLPAPDEVVPSEVWRAAEEAEKAEAIEAEPDRPSEDVLALVDARESARARRDWPAADTLRERIADMGWQIADTREGPRLSPSNARGRV